MMFLNAGLLAAGLASIAIPILIHLLMRRRRKPVMWGAMRFLLEAYRKTRRRLLLERWLLLAARCLLVALAALAVGRPILGAVGGDKAGGRTVYLVVDNSLTASVRDGGGKTALERHLAGAKAALSGLGEGDRAGLVLLGAPADKLVLPPSANIAAVSDLLGTIDATDSRADFGGAFAAIASSVADVRAKGSSLGLGVGGVGGEAAERTFVLVLSDLRAGGADIETTLPRLPSGVRLMVARPSDQPADNVSVRSASPMRSILLADQLDQSQTVTVMLERSGPGVQRAAASQVGLRIERTGPKTGENSGGSDGVVSRAGQATVRWAAGQREAAATVALDAGAGGAGSGGKSAVDAGAAALRASAAGRAGVISVSIDNDAIAGDNLYRVPVEVRETLRVGIIGAPRSKRTGDPESLSGSDWMALALRPREDAAVEVATLEASPLDVSQLAGLDALIITTPDRIGESDWPRLRAWAESSGSTSGPGGVNGGVLIVTPPGDKTVHTWPDAMLAGLGLPWTIAREAKVFAPDDADRPRLGPGSAEAPTAGSLLAPIRAELAELARPVNILRVLPIMGTPDGGVAELALSDGAGVVWVGALGGVKKPGEGGAAPATAGGPEEPKSQPMAGRGLFVYIASAMELGWTDLPVKPLMVPMVQEIIRQGVGRARTAGSVIAGHPIASPAQTAQLRAVGEGAEGSGRAGEGQVSIIPIDEFGAATKPIRRAGVWEAVDSGGGRRATIVINPDASAGNTTIQEPPVLEAWLNKSLVGGQLAWVNSGEGDGAAGVAQALQLRAEGRPTGAWLLLGALVLALAELGLARWASHGGS